MPVRSKRRQQSTRHHFHQQQSDLLTHREIQSGASQSESLQSKTESASTCQLSFPLVFLFLFHSGQIDLRHFSSLHVTSCWTCVFCSFFDQIFLSLLFAGLTHLFFFVSFFSTLLTLISNTAATSVSYRYCKFIYAQYQN